MLRGVLLVPGLGTNLYSVGTATEAGAQILFDNDTVSLSRNGVILLEGSRAGRTLYHLKIIAEEHPPQVEKASQAVKLQPLSIWHLRFGHLSTKTILKMASLGSTNGLALFNDRSSTSSNQCKGCQLGKMCRLQFDLGRQRGKQIGQLVHSDVCAPLQVSTPSGNRFFVIFKDDYSGWCVTRLLKHKSEVAANLQEFAALMKTQTGKILVTIRSDNGGEYLGKELQDWMVKMVSVMRRVPLKLPNRMVCPKEPTGASWNWLEVCFTRKMCP